MIATRTMLLCAAGGLALLAGIETVTPASRPAHIVMHPVSTRGTHAAPASVAIDPADLIATITARPLLRPDRRPIARPDTPQASQNLPRLSGILISHGIGVAMFADDQGKTLMRAKGSTIGRYRVTRITAGGVTLTTAHARIVLSPRFAKLVGSTTPAAPRTLPQLKLETPGRE